MTKDELEWALKLQSGASASASVGVAPKTPPAPPPAQPVAYAPVYYPGAADLAGAALVSLGPGEDRGGIDVAGVLVPTATLSGRVFDADGQPAAGIQVRIESTKSSGGGITDLITNLMGRAGTRINNDEFTMANVPPGHYRIIARGKPPAPPVPAGAAPARPAANAGAFDFMGMLSQNGRGLTLWAEQEIDVDGTDQSGIVLRLQPGLSVSGRIVFETTNPQPPDASRVRIGVSPATNDTGSSPMEAISRFMTGTFVNGQQDGTFVVSGLSPDVYRPMFVPPNMMMPPPLMPVQPGGFVLKSVMLDGKDISDLPIEVRSGVDVKDLVVTFTDTISELSGTLQDSAGKPVIGYPIVVFSTNRAYWTFGSRRIAQTRPSSDGAYKVNGLPAGEYYVCALTDLDPNDLYDAAFLEQLVAGSFKITLGEGEKKVQDLKLGGGSFQ